ncbi:hypothetical protein KJ780_05155, partial [Candidatus Micrarchaeota archaeon]|nr:hypothetical protein [Candidatus Micrarchaeota archaeon]
MDPYKVEIIPAEKKNQLMFGLMKKKLFEEKANIHGTCVKFFTDCKEFAKMWDKNFHEMSDEIRPHCRVFAVSEGKSLKVLYEPLSKTVFIFNCDYYGWVKSIALALVSEFMEDFVSEHRRYSVHGSLVDFKGNGIAIMGPSGSG